MNKISIITVNLNNRDGLKITIESVIAQTYRNYEFIVVDGASTDGSVSVIEENQSGIHYWVSEPDRGIFHAMNKGIIKATGDYCLFLNSGDSFADNEVLMSIFENNTFSAPFINGNQINDFEGHKKVVRNVGRPLSLYDFYWGTIKHQATFIRREMFDTYGLYDEDLKIISDWKFFLQTIGLHNRQPVYVDVDIVNFAWYGMSTDKSLQDKHDKEREKVLTENIQPSIRADYEKMHELKDFEYIVELMKRNKVFSFLVRSLVKIFK